MARRVTLLALPAALLAATASAQPPDAEAREPSPPVAEAQRLVAEGTDLATERRFDEALVAFKRARALVPDAGTDCLIALTYARIERWPQAQLFLSFSRVGAGTRPPWCGAQLERSIQDGLRASGCQPVDVMVVPPEARVEVSAFATDEVIPGSWRIWLPVGRHTLTFMQHGYERPSIDIEVRPGTPQRVNFTLTPLTTTPAPGRGPVPPPRRGAPPDAPPAAGPGAWPWLALSLGVAAAGTGVAFHALAVDSRDAAAALPAGPDFDARLDEFQRRRALAIGAYALGAAGVAVGAYLFARPRPRGAPVAGVAAGEGTVLGWVRWTVP